MKTALFKKWLIVFLSLITLLMVLVALFNYTTDSVGVFHPDRGLADMVQNLFDGNCVAGAINYEERELQRFIIEKQKNDIDVIVIGSSRTMSFKKSFLGIQKGLFFNHSMAAASLEDYIGIAGVYDRLKKQPKVIILGIDPWIFNSNNGLTRWQAFGNDYTDMVSKIYGKKVVSKETSGNRILRLFNFEYTSENYKYIRKKKRKHYVVQSVEIDDFVREPDGTLHFPFHMRYRKENDTLSVARLYPADNDPYLSRFDRLSNTKLFEDFIGHLKRRQIQIILFLPPFHPASFERIQRSFKEIIEVETYLRAFAERKGISILGSYDPGRYRFENKDFFDGSHGHPSVIEKIFSGFTLK